MPLAQVLRRWLWRLNGVLLLCAIVAWGCVLFARPEASPIAVADVNADRPASPEAVRTTWAELKAVFGPYYGDPEAKPAPPPKPRPVAVLDGRLPLRAYHVACFWHDPDGDHGILLKSKDPSRSEVFLPTVVRPHKGLQIERVWREGGDRHITVFRDEERWTFVTRDGPIAHRDRVRFRRSVPGPGCGFSDNALARTATAAPRADVKVLPFYGSDGALLGGRVTGVRPGSSLAQAGLAAGDVIVGVNENPMAGLEPSALCTCLRVKATSIDVLRGVGDKRERIALHP